LWHTEREVVESWQAVLWQNYLIFFTKDKPTEKIWYYDLSDIEVGKKTPLTVGRFDDSYHSLGCKIALTAQ
jgi:hypothetical protein